MVSVITGGDAVCTWQQFVWWKELIFTERPEYSSEKGLLEVWQGLMSHFLKRCLKLLLWKGEVDVVAMPGP